MDMIVEVLQEKFPKWQFDVRNSLVLSRKDDPEAKAHMSYSAKAWTNKEEQIKSLKTLNSTPKR